MPLPRDVDADDAVVRRTMESFGYEWTTFDRIQPEDKDFWQRYFQDVPFDQLRDARTLDAGCGKGRFAFFTAPRVQTLVALDGSRAAQAAARNLAECTNVSVIQSDLRRTPFREETFDLVYCLGVLHHLPDPEAGFRSLTRLVAKGGYLLIYVYSRSERWGIRAAALSAADLMRRLTRKMPHPMLRWTSIPIAALLWLAFVLPGALGDRLRVRFLSSLPLATYRNRHPRSLWLDTFDRLSAPIEKRYVWAEIRPWFVDAGFDVTSVREDAGLIVLARNKPQQ